jgi:hypothetical protein
MVYKVVGIGLEWNCVVRYKASHQSIQVSVLSSAHLSLRSKADRAYSSADKQWLWQWKMLTVS